MLNHSDYFITALEFPYEPECGWSVKASFTHRRNGKKTSLLFTGRDSWMRVADQCKRQIASNEFVRVTHEPKPKKRVVVAAPIGKVKGKGKQKKA